MNDPARKIAAPNPAEPHYREAPNNIEAEQALLGAILVQDGVIHTPDPDCFLDGITRRTVIDLARRRGFEVIERRIMPDELTGFSECFITGTAAEVTAVAQIDKWNFNPGGITKQLMDDYTAEVQPKSRAA